MVETNPMVRSPSPADRPDPTVSMTTLAIAGIQVDVYGLAELGDSVTNVSCLWLHHPRVRSKEDMAYIAHGIVSKFNSQQSSSSSSQAQSTRGLIAVAFNQRNHGSRLVDAVANEAWRSGNKTHAQDMFGTVSGTVVDTIHLLDVLEGYLFGAGDGPGAGRGQRRIDSNIVLGVSLGGHSGWQLMFAEPRVTAGVIVIGCPDYMNLMRDRARLSKLQTFTADTGASFIGSKDFPQALVRACEKFDAKGILFGTGDIPETPSASEQDRLREILDSKIRGKKFQVLSGGADKLVPYNKGEAFMKFFKNAVDGWYKDGNIYLEDNVYAKVGHNFNPEMFEDATRFVLDTVSSFDADGRIASKI